MCWNRGGWFEVKNCEELMALEGLYAERFRLHAGAYL